MARTRLANPDTTVTIKHQPNQQAFLHARRLRRCPKFCTDRDGHTLEWSMLDSLTCPACGAFGFRPFNRLYACAGRQSGKSSICGGLSAVEELLSVPGSVGWACAPTHPELEDYVIPAFLRLLPQDYWDHPMSEWLEAPRYTFTAPNRAVVKFRSLDDPNRATGDTIDWLWIDEGRKIQEHAWHLAQAMLVVKNGIAFITSSPDWGDDWCYLNFGKPAEEGVPGFFFTTWKTTDSPVIDPAIIEQARATMPPALFRREFEASREYPTGTIYGDVLTEVEASDDQIREWLPEFPNIDPTRPSIVGLDPGTDLPFAAVIGIVTQRGIVVIDEYEERQKPFIEHARALRAKTAALGITPRWGIDKSGAQAALELAQHGIYAQAAMNDVDAGIQRVYSWMAVGQLRIARSRCPNLVRCLRQYRYADPKVTDKGVQKPAPYKKDDHLPDGLRYMVMMWPELPRAVKQALQPGERDLSQLPAHERREIMQNLSVDNREGNLVRVTDDFTPSAPYSREVDDGLGDFYR